MEPFSTLEVGAPRYPTPFGARDEQKVVRDDPGWVYAEATPIEITGTDAYSRNEVYHFSSEKELSHQPQSQVPNQSETRVCGIKRRRFYIGLVVSVVVVIAAAIGGAVGGVLGSRRPQSEIADTQDPTTPGGAGSGPGSEPITNVLSSTKLSSSNFTDFDGFTHRSVFFQDPRGASLPVRPGSQLACAWQRSWRADKIGNWAVAYQQAPGDIMVANSTSWSSPAVVVSRDVAAVNSSLALVPQLGLGGSTAVERVALLSQRLTSPTSGPGQKAMYDDGWDSDDGRIFETIPSPSARLQFAITLLQDFTQTVFLVLLPDGTVSANWYAGGFHPIAAVNFNGGPSHNFSAISTTEEGFLYAVSGDEVLEYAADQGGPSYWKYVGRVYP
ncbi:hypothetical protein F4778DRAFT_763812 [Xylariomycetidae sp. FL2044]|nr:hypothetical protein F4778DRAFT_763812 [Xylariomycetidae sp. FL2044]